MESFRLLLVEDNAVVAECIRHALAEEQFDVRVVDAGRRVIGEILHRRPDAVILDLTLPDLDGVVVAELVRRDWPDLPIIFTSGHPEPASLAALLRHPHTAFLQKPFEIETLVRAISRTMHATAKLAR